MSTNGAYFRSKITRLNAKCTPKLHPFNAIQKRNAWFDSDFGFMMLVATLQQILKSEMKKKYEKIRFNKNQNRSIAPFPFETEFIIFLKFELALFSWNKLYYSMHIRYKWIELSKFSSQNIGLFVCRKLSNAFFLCPLFSIHSSDSFSATPKAIDYFCYQNHITMHYQALLSPHKSLWLKISFWMSSINFIYHHLLTFFEIPLHFWTITFDYYYIKLHLKWKMFNLLTAANQRTQEESLK